MNTRWLRPLLLLLPVAACATATADELEDVRSLRDTTIALVKALVEQGVLTKEKADEIIRKAEQAGKSGPATAGAPAAAGTPPVAGTAPARGTAPAAGAAPATVAPANPANAPGSGAVEPGVIRVPYVPEVVKQQIRDEVKAEVLAQAKQERWGEPGAYPDWLHRISFAGDVRFRFQRDRFPNDNIPNAPPEVLQLPPNGAYNINNTADPRNRLRLRVRFGAEAQLGNTVTAALRLTTGTVGNGSDPSTENQNLGNYNTRSTVGFDLAYISYHPTSWVYFAGGRVGNPFFAPTTLVWGDDLSLEGAVAGLKPKFGESFQPFLTAGAFPIQDVEPTPLTSSHSKWLWAGQAGFKWLPTSGISWTLAAALYDYRHIEGTPNPTVVSTVYNLTAAPFRQKGNSVFDINELANTVNGTQNYLIGLASKFHEANLSSTLDLAAFAGKHVFIDADYVKNLGFNRAEILARTGLTLPEQTTGWQARATFGDRTFAHRNSWNAYVGYRHVESDAVVDAFTDSDFRLGGTDATGYFMGARYAFESNSTIGVRWFSAKQIDGLPLAIDVLQIDLIAAF